MVHVREKSTETERNTCFKSQTLPFEIYSASKTYTLQETKAPFNSICLYYLEASVAEQGRLCITGQRFEVLMMSLWDDISLTETDQIIVLLLGDRVWNFGNVFQGNFCRIWDGVDFSQFLHEVQLVVLC